MSRAKQKRVFRHMQIAKVQMGISSQVVRNFHYKVLARLSNGQVLAVYMHVVGGPDRIDVSL